ncbi:MAG: glutamate-cysteine ligase family protein [Chryseolinea sp.]
MLHLFQAFGVELEYMIVDRDTLKIKPVTDELLKHELGQYGSDVEKGIVSWSNELVLHVVELKSTRTESDLPTLMKQFAENVKYINTILKKWNAMLMPTAAHPFMNPSTETKLWPHDSNEVYAVYNKIFDCRGHGWSNLQSTHLNLPFSGDEEFAKLHAAIRLVLPILPALCASSPILESKRTGVLDTRLTYYKVNQIRIPSITGQIIPEPVFSEIDYENTIYKKIRSDIAPFDPEEILDPIWVNSRGAMARFDRGSIEIRVMDIQECPAADIAIVTLVIETIKALVAERFIDYKTQTTWTTESLVAMLDQTASKAQDAQLNNSDYLRAFNFPSSSATAGALWKHIVDDLLHNGNAAIKECKSVLDVILTNGTLSQRIINALGSNLSNENMVKIYKQLSDCLEENKLFLSKS